MYTHVSRYNRSVIITLENVEKIRNNFRLWYSCRTLCSHIYTRDFHSSLRKNSAKGNGDARFHPVLKTLRENSLLMQLWYLNYPKSPAIGIFIVLLIHSRQTVLTFMYIYVRIHIYICCRNNISCIYINVCMHMYICCRNNIYLITILVVKQGNEHRLATNIYAVFQIVSLFDSLLFQKEKRLILRFSHCVHTFSSFLFFSTISKRYSFADLFSIIKRN